MQPATDTEPTTPPRNGLEVVRQERMRCQLCGGTTVEVVLGAGATVQYRCAGCGAWVRRPRRR